MNTKDTTFLLAGKIANQLNKFNRNYKLLRGLMQYLYHWIEVFESGKNSVENDSCSGHPQETSTPENIAKVDDLISDDPHITITAIEEVEISKQLLEILDNGLNNIIIGDETYAVPSKESNKIWVKSGENQLQITRTTQNAKKRMFCDFCSDSPCDFFLFLRIKKELKNKHFDHIENLACAIQAITDGITKEDYQNHLKIVKIGYKNA
nr:8865_t:CDS:2 [Entrophospora candida]